MKLKTTLSHLDRIPNKTNKLLLVEFHEYLKEVDTSENYQNQMLKELISFAEFLGKNLSFYEVKGKEQVTTFLETKIKSVEVDPDKKWITTYNDYLWRIKYLFRCPIASLISIESPNPIVIEYGALRPDLMSDGSV